MPRRDAITGLVLAGGRGSRMGGVDKGLVVFEGRALAARAAARLAPQVARVIVSANRHLADYATLGLDAVEDLADVRDAGPLGGVLSALEQLRPAWLAVVPCDAPHAPPDVVARLAAASSDDVDVAVAQTTDGHWQPTFCLVRGDRAPSLRAWLATGQRAMHRWIASERHATVTFDDADAFVNVNTREALASLEAAQATDG